MSKVVTSSSTTPSTPSTHSTHSSHIPHDRIAMRAFEKWCKRGRPHGTDKQDWHEAESELHQEHARSGGSQPQGQAQGRR